MVQCKEHHAMSKQLLGSEIKYNQNIAQHWIIFKPYKQQMKNDLRVELFK